MENSSFAKDGGLEEGDSGDLLPAQSCSRDASLAALIELLAAAMLAIFSNEHKANLTLRHDSA